VGTEKKESSASPCWKACPNSKVEIQDPEDSEGTFDWEAVTFYRDYSEWSSAHHIGA
jgi:hypothetical protein